MTMETQMHLNKAKDIPELFSILHSEYGDNYQGIGQNVIFADTSGNIGYKLVMSVPERVEKTPYIGSRVLDGTTTSFDWTGRAIDLKDLPYGVNPEKGFYQTANGMQTSGHVANDYSASMNSPARTLRIDAVLREKIASGKKLKLKDLGDLQQDVIDIIAEQITPKVLEIIKGAKKDLTADQVKSVDEMVAILSGWDGSFDLESVPATLYTRWKIQFYRNLFAKYLDDESQRMALGENYHFTDTYQRLVTGVLAEKEESYW